MLLFITVNELFITSYVDTLKTHHQEMQSYSYHLNELQTDIYQKFESSPNQEAQTFYYMDLIQNGIKSNIVNWVMNNTQNQIDMHDIEGTNYFSLLTKQTIWALFISLIILIVGIRSVFIFQKNMA